MQGERVRAGVVCVLAGGRSSRFGSDKAQLRVGAVPILTWHRQRVIEPLGMASMVSLPAAAPAPPAPPDPPDPQASPAPTMPEGAADYEFHVRDRQAYAGPLVAIADVLAHVGAYGVQSTGSSSASCDLGEDMTRQVAALHGEPVRGVKQAWLVFLPVDMPAMTLAVIERLLVALRADAGVAAAMGCWADGPRGGEVEPFPLACNVTAGLGVVRDAMAAGARGPRDLADRPGVARVPLDSGEDGPAYLNVNRVADAQRVARVLGVRVDVA